MIVNLRGTSGSGKSTIVREVMGVFQQKVPRYCEGRKQPTGYELFDTVYSKLFVPGHYESPCGGCDTLSFSGSQDRIWEWIREHHARGYNVLFEGVIIGDDNKRTIQAHRDKLPLLLIELTTNLNNCLAGIQARRDARGDTRPINPSNTTKRMPGISKRMDKFERMGRDVRRLTRGDALELCRRMLCP